MDASTPLQVVFQHELVTPINHLSMVVEDEDEDDATLVAEAEKAEEDEEVAASVAAFLVDEKLNRRFKACKRRLFDDFEDHDEIDVFFKKMKFF